jgi:hypothetical protein
MKLSRWDDPEWLALSHTAQWLYDTMVSSAKLSSCGVLEWRPKQFRKLSAAMTIDLLEAAFTELRERLYVVYDEEVELVLIRSFIRNDDVVHNKNMMVNVIKSWRQVGSIELKRVMTFELLRLKSEQPEQAIWSHPEMIQTLRTPPLDPEEWTGYRKGMGSDADLF